MRSASSAGSAALAFPTMLVNQLTDGQDIDIVLLVRDREVRTKRDGGEYLKLGAGRPHGLASPAMMWDDVADGRARSARPAARVRVAGRYGVHPRYGAQIAVQTLRAAEPDEVDLDALTRRPAALRRADGGRPARARRHDPEPAPARAARRDLRRRHADVGAVPRRAGGQALPPGLPPRAARALPLGRPVGVGDLGHVPGHRPRGRGHRRAAARHRQARRLRLRPARRST